MNVERTIEYILQLQAKAEVRQAKAEERQAKAEAKAQREMAAIRTLIKAGMKMIAKTDAQIKDLFKAQKVTETKLQGLIDSMRRGGNGNHRNN